MLATLEHTTDSAMLGEIRTDPTVNVPHSKLSREHLIDGIIAINPTATVTFLTRFPDAALRGYLDHLLSAQEPRGRTASWVRPGDSPAIVVREPID